MAGPPRLASFAHLASLARLALLASLLATVTGGLASPAPASAALPRWTGGVDLYRAGVFTTQGTWYWCTAADVQIMRNIVTGAADHSTANQRTYFDYMRAHNHYSIPVSDGTDPAGWTAGLHHWVDARYRLVVRTSFDAALRSAVTDLRLTNRPVALAVQHGNHGWVLTGFTATADPAVTTRFTVTSVRVVGPLWGLQSRSYGYDMRPDTKLTPVQLATFFTPWHYAPVTMPWEGEWLSIQAVPATASTPKPAATPKPTPRPSVPPVPAASPVPATTPSPSPTPSPAPTSPAELVATSAPSAPAAALAVPATSTDPPAGTGPGTRPPQATSPGATAITVIPVVIGLAVLLLVAAGILLGGARRGAGAAVGRPAGRGPDDTDA